MKRRIRHIFEDIDAGENRHFLYPMSEELRADLRD